LNPAFAGSRWPRLKFMTSLSAIIDLLSILPALFAIAGGATLALRFVRFFRILRLAKLGRFSSAWRDLGDAVRSRKEELFLAFSLAGFTILIASTLMFWAEGEAQPEKFGSIPRTFWWAIVTMTTVGYGDVYPITPVGRFLSGMVSVAAIGLIALPTGILAAAMSDVMQRRRGGKQD
jgi:voltage-gated potassium channel